MNEQYKQQELWQSTKQACTLPHVSNRCLQDELLSGVKLLALSWKEPFASLMLYGKIETRVWPTKYRGLVLICSTKTDYSQQTIIDITGKQFGRAMDILQQNKINWNETKGKAIAIGRLVDCRKMLPGDEEKCFVKYYHNLFCHIYEDVQPIKPIIWKGKQGWTSVSQDFIRSIELR